METRGIETGAEAAGDRQAPIPRDRRLGNYLALVALVPTVLSVMACELLIFVFNSLAPGGYHVDQLFGLGMLVPMGLMTEGCTYLLARRLIGKERTINDAIQAVAEGDYTVKLDVDALAPFSEVALDFNRMTDRLSSVETLRRDFTGNFSHEFKTPIASINGFANLLLDTDVNEEDRRQYLQIIADESARLARLSQDTMLMSRLDTATELPDVRPYRLDSQIREDIILLSRDWEGKDIALDVDLDQADFRGNASLMAHVWINLVGNAIKFTPEGGAIRVSLHREGDELVARVADTGRGMSPEECERAFDRYYQADPSHAGKGLGLGLAIVRKIVELSGGTVGVTSEPGQGSCFTVRLPAVKEG